MKNSVMGYVVSASKMVWKQRYISDDQWEQLYWEFLNCCFLVWKHPIQSAAFLIWGPRLIKMLMFFYPLMITTILFLLIRFSLGPQLERMRVDRDIQWNRFKEAAVDEDVSGGSWRYQKPCGKLEISKQVNRNIAKGGGDSVELTESLEDVDRPIVFTEKEHRDTIEINDMNVDFHKGTEEEVEHDAGPIGVSSKSLILGKVRELMERLIDELGGRVELDALNALESITQILMESTGRYYQNGGKYCHPFTTVKFECDLSDDEQFQKTVCDEDCKLPSPFSDNLKSENIDYSRDDVKEEKNSILLAKLETQHQKPDCRQSHTTSYVLESHCFTRLEINCQTIVDLEAAAGSMNERDQGKNSILLNRDDALSDDAQATGHVADLEFTTDSENAGETFKEQDDTAPSHQCREWGESLDIDEANLSGSQDVGTGSPVQDREDWVEGLSDLGHCELRSCRSLSIEALKNDFSWMSQSLEIEKGNGLKKIFSNKYNRDQREHHHMLPFSGRNPQQNSKQPCVLAGKLKSCPSEPITFVKKTQLSASPVMRLETEEMDLLWEKYNDVSQGQLSARKDPIADLDSDLSGIVDSDMEDQKEASQVCCLQAFKLSKGKMPLRKPNLKKISKALKKLALFQNFRSRKTAQI